MVDRLWRKVIRHTQRLDHRDERRHVEAGQDDEGHPRHRRDRAKRDGSGRAVRRDAVLRHPGRVEVEKPSGKPRKGRKVAAAHGPTRQPPGTAKDRSRVSASGTGAVAAGRLDIGRSADATAFGQNKIHKRP